MAEITISHETAVELKVRCHAELARYAYAKRKAMEIGSEGDREVRVITKRFGT